MYVKDIMEPLTSWLTPEQTLQDAICTMRKTKRNHGLSVNGMLVLENGIKLVGVVSIKDVIKVVMPFYMGLGEKLGSFSWEGMLEERIEQVKSLQIRDIMSPQLKTISEEDTVMHCADIMLKNNLQRLPVVEPGGRIIGVVYIRDIYKTISTLLCKDDA